jgi:hypothetical protein
MNLGFLGDALDHWKGSLFEFLQNARAVEDLAVEPMASDLSTWTEDDFLLFARLLRVQPGQILRHSKTLKDRHAYFAEITHHGDLFVDPDTGVATGNIRKREQYITPIEVGHLLPAESRRLLAIYQHVRAQRVAKRVDAVLGVLTREIGAFSWSSYESGTVAMLFLSRDNNRISKLARLFEKVLGRHAKGRIRQGVLP